MNQQTLNSITLAAIYTPFFSIYIQDFFFIIQNNSIIQNTRWIFAFFHICPFIY